MSSLLINKNNGGMSLLFINQSRSYRVIVTWVVRVRTLRPDSDGKWPEGVDK